MEEDKILRRPEVAKLIGLSEITISREERAGRFPKRRLIGARSVGWLASEVMEWISKRVAAEHAHTDKKPKRGII